jgi:hypothetical protein
MTKKESFSQGIASHFRGRKQQKTEKNEETNPVKVSCVPVTR